MNKEENQHLVMFDESAFLMLGVPEECRPGVQANLELLNLHAERVQNALEAIEKEGGE